ncbi:uncharacterized protein L969DRAFT_44651 [Mixia osmundae IAM 14324]|uniref:Uncharacterized protein n=1 Tax=Mixia osmundae (strain CBS 9802 / IAM 14324 / JCM 22182 / KY 12970) TaxID=764103 RepID=G7DTQ6_MIXOS|nr:uncharacterized protein L969DRAFT_44651 [Mixia osmundae IAM 14324]KEI41681.1 hypothetical protein L969DRAFT_44651 [Mixia osmundae IAM 14324]GAA93966.1 hypothetical protein E5Q_00612 [Mixia osmundae IAM 14324]
MGRKKVKKQANAAPPIAAATAKSTANAPATPSVVQYTVWDLLPKIDGLIDACSFDLARQFVDRALALTSSSNDGLQILLVHERAGLVALEQGDDAQAQQHFMQALAAPSHVLQDQAAHQWQEEQPWQKENTQASCHLYLAQMADTPLEALNHLTSAVSLLQSCLITLAKLPTRSDAEAEVRRRASRALVSMTELYLTDLCFDPRAESNSQAHLALASEIDPNDPEVYQTLASVRLSQEKPIEAVEALRKSYALWKGCEPTDERMPSYKTRLGLVRLFVETELYDDALEILASLEQEDDEDPEVLYLIGFVSTLCASKAPDVETRADWQEQAYHSLEAAKQLHASLQEIGYPEVEGDQEMLIHIDELLASLPQPDQEEAEDEEMTT